MELTCEPAEMSEQYAAAGLCLLTQLPYLHSTCPEVEDMAERVFCLPLRPDMAENLIRKIGATVFSGMGRA